MNYAISDIEDQNVSTLQANSDLAGVTVRTHAGEVNMRMFLDPKYYEGLLSLLPFIFLRYSGRVATQMDEAGWIWQHQLRFQMYVGASSLRKRQESQRACYDYLAAIYDAIHGKWPNSSAQSLAVDMPKLSGTQITTTNFNALSPMLQAGGEDEKLVIEMPEIAVYSTMYTIAVVA